MESATIEERRKGSLMVEAGVLLPICLFLLLAMAGAFRFLQLEESLLFSGFNQMQRCSAESIAVAQVQMLLPGRIEQQAQKETQGWNRAGLRCYMKVLFDGDCVQEEAEENRLTCLVECGWRSGEGRMAGVFSDRLRFYGRGFSGEDHSYSQKSQHIAVCHV